MEDFNTSTFPHEKFFDLEAWDKKEYKRKIKAKMKKQVRSSFPPHHHDMLSFCSRSDFRGVYMTSIALQGRGKTTFNDEEERRFEEKIRQKKNALNQAFAEINSMTREKAQAMQEQQMLMKQREMAWKAGNTAEYERLSKLVEAPP